MRIMAKRNETDRDMIEQMLINLLKNAEQALADTPCPRVELSGKLNKRGHVVIEIEDNGPGIPEEIQHNLFDAFCTSGKADGVGLGLVVTRNIINAHGGSISAENNSHGGATVVITLPAAGMPSDQQIESGTADAAI